MTTVRFKLILLLLFQPLDGLFTYIGIQRADSIYVEGNPILLWLLENNSSEALILFFTKLIACIFVLFIYLTLKEEPTKLFRYVINICLLIYTYVILTWLYVLTIGALS